MKPLTYKKGKEVLLVGVSGLKFCATVASVRKNVVALTFSFNGRACVNTLVDSRAAYRKDNGGRRYVVWESFAEYEREMVRCQLQDAQLERVKGLIAKAPYFTDKALQLIERLCVELERKPGP